MPSASKKGAASSRSNQRDRRSVSRHSTPVSGLTETTPSTPLTATPHSTTNTAKTDATTSAALPRETPYLHTPTTSLISAPDLTLDALISAVSPANHQHHHGPKSHDPPSARDLHNLHDRIRDSLLKSFEKRGETCERNIRLMAQRRKERERVQREQEAAEQAERAERVKREREDEAEERRKKKNKNARESVEGADGGNAEGLPTLGAHGLARQDGVGVHQGQAPPPSPPVEPGTVDAMDTAVSPTDSTTSDPDPPATAPLYERAFGKDPTAFDDPTIYDIRDLRDDMSDDEKQAILNVAQWPPSDLRDQTAGDAPDMDLSNAKPANQVNFTTFQTYVEPFIRPFTEEDVAFLKERSDRMTPYIIPQRGNRGYKEVWAAEDGLTGIEAPRREELDPNIPRGSMDDMGDDTAETDEVSMGPVMNRLLSILRPQPNTNKSEESTTDANGDLPMTNGDADLLADPLAFPNGINLDDSQTALTNRPVTALPPDALRPLTNLPTPDYDTFETRALQELKYIGLLSPADTPNTAAHEDDEVSARLRTLQAELRKVAARNNARRARVLELTEERMAMQEYANIADDLDNQVNAAYLKRNRSLGKPSNKKGGGGGSHQVRAGQKGVAGVVGGGAGRGVSEGVRALMQKRRDWIGMVGPVVGYGRAPIPGELETVFDDETMRRLERAEKEAEAGEGDGD